MTKAPLAKTMLTKSRLTMAASALALCFVVGGGVVAADAQAQGLDLTQESRTSAAGPSDSELDAICAGDWFVTWEEDAKGNAIVGTYNLHCAGEAVPIG